MSKRLAGGSLSADVEHPYTEHAALVSSARRVCCARTSTTVQPPCRPMLEAQGDPGCSRAQAS